MEKITIRNNNLEATFTNYGARLMNLWVPDSKGKLKDIVLGFDDPKSYISAEEQYYGATVGRYANRIANGKISIEDKNYDVTINNPPNHLHGGTEGFHTKIWEVILQEENRLVMSCTSLDNEEGFPGNITASVSFELTDDNALNIQYKVNTDATTVINLTHHSYFNLRGHDDGDILNHLLTISSDKITATNEHLIPTGEYLNVAQTPFDFRTAKRIGKEINTDFHQLNLGKGYDHNFVLKTENSPEIIHAATVYEPEFGRIMEVYTNQPGIQLYTANWLSGNKVGKSAAQYKNRSAFCLETQHFPDSPNQAHFPSCILHPNDTYEYSCKYLFKTI